MKFLVDRMLGRLCTWLRIWGFDTAYYDAAYSRRINLQSLQESRTVLTRNSRVSAKRSYRYLFIRHDRIHDQLKQVVDAFHLTLARSRLFSRCTYCNEPVKTIHKNDTYGKVPAYVFKTVDHFSSCPSCRRIYWKGTHDRLLTEEISAMGFSLET